TNKTPFEHPPTSDLTEFDLYNRAKNILLTTSFNANVQPLYSQAVQLLNQAIARDPSFFEAYCLLAYGHDNLYFLGNDHTPARLAQAETAIQSAFRLRPDAGEAHLARAENLYRGYLDYDGALAELEIARRTLPNDSRVPELTGYIVRRQVRHEEAVKYLQRALELDPRNFFILEQIALSYQNLRRYPEMAAMLDRGLAIKPGDVEIGTTRASVDLDWKADPRPLHQMLQSLNSDVFNNGAHMIEYFAMIAAWVGDRDLACEQLAKAIKLPGTLSYGQLKLLPYWDLLRGDPRFEKIVAPLAPKN